MSSTDETPHPQHAPQQAQPATSAALRVDPIYEQYKQILQDFNGISIRMDTVRKDPKTPGYTLESIELSMKDATSLNDRVRVHTDRILRSDFYYFKARSMRSSPGEWDAIKPSYVELIDVLPQLKTKMEMALQLAGCLEGQNTENQVVAWNENFTPQ